MLNIKMPISHVTAFIKYKDDTSAVRTCYLVGKFTSPEITDKVNKAFNLSDDKVKKVMVMDVVKDAITCEVTDCQTDIESLAYNAISPNEEEPVLF